jgi:hypothetical protein
MVSGATKDRKASQRFATKSHLTARAYPRRSPPLPQDAIMLPELPALDAEWRR